MSDVPPISLLKYVRRFQERRIVVGFIPPVASGAGHDVLDRVAKKYVKLILALSEHDPDSIDAYFGPSEWQTQVRSDGLRLDEVAASVSELLKDIECNGSDDPAENVNQRRGNGNCSTICTRHRSCLRIW